MLTHDPRKDVTWPLSAAEAWVSTRSYQSVADSWISLTISEELRKDFRTREARAIVETDGIAWQEFEASFQKGNLSEKADKAFTAYWLRRPEDHYIDLWTELQRGQISAWGMKPQEAEYSEIPPIQFEALRIRSCSNIGTFFAGDVYRLVRLDSAEVQRAFPLFGAKPQIRGRPPKYDWQEFHIQCRTVWEYHGSFNKHDPQFSRQADLVKIMAEWCVEKWGREPSLSQLKSEVAKFLAAMAEK